MNDRPFVGWGAPLVEARFRARPNRFVVHAEVDGAEVVAHLADPGRLRELLIPGARMGLRPETPSATRKTAWTALLVETPDGNGWVSVNTTIPNRLIDVALRAGALEEFDGWRYVRREVPWGASRLDFLMEREGPAPGTARLLYVEAKSVTLVEGGVALFPDAVTARGARHLEELIHVVEAGHAAAVLFVLQRPDAGRIVAARHIDPVFSDTLARAEASGVRVLGRRCRVGWDGIELLGAVPAGAG
ncbi:MAG: DNA/RNA nuclease SfsA [Longimicrobiales bacterium]